MNESPPIAPVEGCEKHRPFPTSYCRACREMWNAANPQWRGPYPDEIKGSRHE